jgi:hypothetical protein
MNQLEQSIAQSALSPATPATVLDEISSRITNLNSELFALVNRQERALSELGVYEMPDCKDETALPEDHRKVNRIQNNLNATNVAVSMLRVTTEAFEKL